MGLLSVENWLKAPASRDLIERWTAVVGTSPPHSLAFPAPADPQRFTFLAVGDTGDAAAVGAGVSPQDAVAIEMAADAATPGSSGAAEFLIHVGDVVYMTGERRLYDRNFRRPYAPFLTPESTVDSLVFRVPFLPVPGNHDYYDLGGWARLLASVPLLGRGVRALTHELFSFSVPQGGSEMGRTYMRAFVDLDPVPLDGSKPYLPGQVTKLPNRYYQFRVGSVDFFALDSNTLEAPHPSAGVAQVRADAAARITALEAEAEAIDRQLSREHRALEEWLAAERWALASNAAELTALGPYTDAVTASLAALDTAFSSLFVSPAELIDARNLITAAQRRWSEGLDDLSEAEDAADTEHALDLLDEASDCACAAARGVEGVLSALPEGSERATILTAQKALETSLHAWSLRVSPAPEELCARVRLVTEKALDIQRDLALERRRSRYRAEDYDDTQLQWLDEELARSERERPDAWRVVYLHHPIYTAIANHCEHPDVIGMRENLVERIRGRVHLVIAGHAHAFEWFRSQALLNTGIIVTGGGGQVALRRSLLDTRLGHRHRARYDALRRAGVVEYAAAGRGPAASDGASGLLFHYLRIDVSPDVLRVRPVGVRRLERGYRREDPMPVFHAASLPTDHPPWRPRRLISIDIRRGVAPTATWL